MFIPDKAFYRLRYCYHFFMEPEKVEEYEKKLANERMLSGVKNPVPNLVQGEQSGKTEDIMAKKIGVSHNTYKDMKYIVQW